MKTVTPLGEEKTKKHLDLAITTMVVITVLLLFLILLASLFIRYVNHREGINTALSYLPVDHSAVLSYLSSFDIGIIKISAIFISFLIIFTGSLYLLRLEKSKFYTSTEAQGNLKFILSTTSPGLVMIFLGTILVIFSLYKKTTIEYEAPNIAPPIQRPAEALDQELPETEKEE